MTAENLFYFVFTFSIFNLLLLIMSRLFISDQCLLKEVLFILVCGFLKQLRFLDFEGQGHFRTIAYLALNVD